jgi:hypothetical protein
VPRPQTARNTVEDLPATPHHHRRSRPSADVALLAATALGFAYAPTGNDETHARRLVTLAHPHPGSLPRAQAAVLALEIGSVQARTRAAALLGSAARLVGDPHDGVLHTEAAVLTDVPLAAAATDDRR